MKRLILCLAVALMPGLGLTKAGVPTVANLHGAAEDEGRGVLDVEEHPMATPDDVLDALDRALTFSAAQGFVRAKVSGLLDIEEYLLSRPAPALLYSRHADLFNPRLTGFLDVEVGPSIYAFAQVRVDRGFDPADEPAEMRLDEYFARWTPLNTPAYTLAIQAGKFATVVGGWTPRHLSWDNPFINAPLPYENVTSAADLEAPGSPAEFASFRAFASGKETWVPVIWGPSYTSGASISGQVAGHYDFAFEFKNAALSSRPSEWDGMRRDWSHPTYGGRLGWRPGPDWNLGVSASAGPYMTAESVPTLPRGRDLSDYWQTTFLQDASYAHGYWQFWAETIESRFEVPNVGDADTFAYYLETRYKLSPGLWAGLRWNQQLFGKIPDGFGNEVVWGNDLWRTDWALGYRWSEHSQAKIQYSFGREHDPSGENTVQVGAVQFTTTF